MMVMSLKEVDDVIIGVDDTFGRQGGYQSKISVKNPETNSVVSGRKCMGCFGWMHTEEDDAIMVMANRVAKAYGSYMKRTKKKMIQWIPSIAGTNLRSPRTHK